MEAIAKELIRKSEALLELTSSNEQQISGKILPLGMQMFKTQKITAAQAKELGAIMMALLYIWEGHDKD